MWVRESPELPQPRRSCVTLELTYKVSKGRRLKAIISQKAKRKGRWKWEKTEEKVRGAVGRETHPSKEVPEGGRQGVGAEETIRAEETIHESRSQNWKLSVPRSPAQLVSADLHQGRARGNSGTHWDQERPPDPPSFQRGNTCPMQSVRQ